MLASSSKKAKHNQRRTTLERSRGASSCVYVNASSSRSHSLETSDADAAINAKSDTALSIVDDVLLDKRIMLRRIEFNQWLIPIDNGLPIFYLVVDWKKSLSGGVCTCITASHFTVRIIGIVLHALCSWYARLARSAKILCQREFLSKFCSCPLLGITFIWLGLLFNRTDRIPHRIFFYLSTKKLWFSAHTTRNKFWRPSCVRSVER